ncbi:ATP synthase subunit b [Rubripirellula amarantea]|uniref:ATP synthase subunit b n=1 Tax=Rubripirellula amarantea TaxID=2527999 RepID=A0A5C5WG12_9BACT|nr:F0F1 ATP synthase subunit B [Rubripirellula amarantea]TWT49708.1 ATP synthase subunit b [Rubripirellula amarantea]
MSFVDSSAMNRLRHLVALLAMMGFVAGTHVVVTADEAAVVDAAHADDHADADHDHADSLTGLAAGHDGDAHGDAEHGSGHDGEEGVPPLLQFDFGSALCNLAIFLGVFAILAKFVWPVILDGLKAREQKIHGDLIAAEKANAEARALLAEYQVKLDEASGQVQTMLAGARIDAEASGKRIVEEAKAEADAQRQRALSDIETAKKVALSELAGSTSDMAMAIAGQVVGRELRPEDHSELIRSSIERMPSNN